MILKCKSSQYEEVKSSLFGNKTSSLKSFDLTVGKEYQIQFSATSSNYDINEKYTVHIKGDKGIFYIQQRKLDTLNEILNELFE